MSFDYGNVSIKKADVQQAISWIESINEQFSLKAIQNYIGKGSAGSIICRLLDLSSGHTDKSPNLYAQCLQAIYSQMRQERDVAEKKYSKERSKNYGLQLHMNHLKQSLKQARRETKRSNALASSAELKVLNNQFQSLEAVQNLKHEKEMFDLRISFIEDAHKQNTQMLLWDIEQLNKEIALLNEVQKITESCRFDIAQDAGAAYSVDARYWVKESQKLQGIIARGAMHTHLLEEELHTTRVQLEKLNSAYDALRRRRSR